MSARPEQTAEKPFRFHPYSWKELTRGRRIVEPGRCLDDYRFQDWLASEGLMKRSADSDLPLRLSRPIKTFKDGEADLASFLGVLSASRGYIVPSDLIYQVTYQTDADDVRDLRLLRNFASNLRPRLPGGIDFCNVPHAGYGLGVSEMPLRGREITLLYLLWRDFGKNLPVSEIALQVQGFSDKYGDANIIKSAVVLRAKLAGTKIRIEGIRLPGLGYAYRLADGDNKSATPRQKARRDLSEQDGAFPKYLMLPFQQWLADLGILQQADPSLDEGPLSPFESKVMGILKQYHGFIVPFEHLSNQLYEDEATEAVKKRICELLRKVRRKRYLAEAYVVKDIGCGMSINGFGLSKSPLQTLHTLWTSIGEPVNIASALPDKNHASIGRDIATIRTALKGSGYRVFTEHGSSTKGSPILYRLQKY